MRTWVKSTSRAALVAAGALAIGAAFGPGTAGAAAFGGGHDGKVTMESSGNFGLLNGNQVYAPISIPIDVCGNAIAVAGLAGAQCEGGASVSSHRSHGGYAADPGYRTAGAWDGGGYGGGYGGGWDGGKGVDMQTSGNFGIANGNQVYAPISVPIDVCGNAVAVLGLAQAQCKGGASVGDGEDHEMPPTLRTPPVKHKKPYKPSKHRPAAKHKKLPSTLRADGRRVAGTGVNYRSADGLPIVGDLLKRVQQAVKVPGVDAQTGRLGPQLPNSGGAPVRIGSPVLS